MKYDKYTERKTYTIQQFCDAYGMSKAYFHKLRKSGLAPKVIQITERKCLITIETADEWCKRMQESSKNNIKGA